MADKLAVTVVDVADPASNAVIVSYRTVGTVTDIIMESRDMRLELREDNCLALNFADLLSDDFLDILAHDGELLLDNRNVD